MALRTAESDLAGSLTHIASEVGLQTTDECALCIGLHSRAVLLLLLLVYYGRCAQMCEFFDQSYATDYLSVRSETPLGELARLIT